MPEHDVTIGELLDSFAAVRPGQVATLCSILANVALPAWRLAGSRSLAGLPAHRLYGLLDGTNARWAPAIAAKQPAGQTHQRAYPRAIRRLIAHGEEAGLLHPDQHAIAPEWRPLVEALDRCLAALPARERYMQRWAFRRLARWCTERGLAPSHAVRPDQDGRTLLAYRASFGAGTSGGYFQARKAWNVLAEARPDLGLARWAADASDAIPLMPRSAWPPVIAEGFARLVDRDGLGGWKAETRRGYTLRLGSYLGALETLGLSPADLIARAPDGVAAMRMLFQGMPDPARDLTAPVLAERIGTDAAFAESLYRALADHAGLHDGRECGPNPFVLAAAGAHAARGRLTSARDLLIKTAAVNRSFLGITERHVGWLARPIQMLELKAKRSPSAYAQKKKGVFRQPDLWRRLVLARGRLREHVAKLDMARAGMIGPERAWHDRRWAVAARNEVILGLLLGYPLRVANLVGMEIERHLDTTTFGIHFEALETKNEREIDYELPEGGALGDLRDLVTRYLSEVRPLLLAGRTSPYVFVAAPPGGVRLRTKAINAILEELSQRFFADVLPPGVEALNPHLLRHATASYHLAIRRDLNMAAQMLGDSPATILKSYSDLLDHGKEATKHFLSTFEP